MKKKLLRALQIVTIFLLVNNTNAQQCLSGGCATFTNQYPLTIYTPTNSWDTHGFMNAGNWTLFNVTNGVTYQWTYCEAYGGVSTGWDAQLTLYNNNNTNTPICFSTDVCGSNGKAPFISWPATFTGVVRILTTVYTNSGCHTNTGSPYNTLAWRSIGNTTQYGSVSVTISPSNAINSGALWNLDGGSWQNSPSTLSNIPTGNHTINYNTISGWTSPSSQSINITSNSTTYITGNYSQNLQYGSVSVNINPSNAVNAGAKWNLDGGVWQSSGATLFNIPIGGHTIYFTTISGWISPLTQSINVTNNSNTNITGAYTQNAQFGNVNVTINPIAASNAGAQWNLDGSNWQNSGTSLSNIPIGNHTIYYNSIPGWVSPASQSVTVSNNATSNITGNYAQNAQYGSVKVILAPNSAVNAGAQWNLDGGNWQNSGVTVLNITIGSHTINYNTIAGWASPNSQTINVSQNNLNNITATYLQNSTTNPTVRVDSPNGGEGLQAGSTYNILVQNSSNVSLLDLYYSSDNGFSWHYISSINTSPSTTSYPWLVNYVATQSALIKVIAHYPGGTITDISDNVFTISVGCINTINDFPYGNNPGFDCNSSSTYEIDYWNFWKFTCTSWVAWKINQEFGSTGQVGAPPFVFTNNKVFNIATRLGNASDWGNVLTQSPFSFIADNIPAVGSIAWYAQNSPGASGGHVAFVNCVSGNDVTLTEYNGGGLNGANHPMCTFGSRIIHMNQPNVPGNRIPTKFIHIEAGGGGAGNTQVETFDFSVFPNPISAIATLRFNAILTESANIAVYNVTGQLVFLQKNVINTNQVNINLSNKPNGVYFIRINSGKFNVAKTVIIAQ